MKIAKDASNGLSLFVPFTKVEEDDDGTIIVEGIATAEVLDSQGDVVMYDASVEAFDEWGEYFHKITDGVSVGNIREMHQPVAAGKAIAWWPDEEKKQIGLRTKAVNPDTCKKIRERVLTGFSIAAPGATVERKSVDWEGQKATAITRYKLGEVSYVDKGACPDAVFTLVKRDIPKADQAKPEGGQDEPGPVKKGYSEAVQAAETAEEAIRAFISEAALLEGDASSWSLRMMIDALSTVQGARRDTEYDAAMAAADGEGEGAEDMAAAAKPEVAKADDPPAAAPATDPPAPQPAASAEPGPVKNDSSTTKAEDLLKGLLESFKGDLLKALDSAKGELAGKLEDFEKRLKVVEETPAEPGSEPRPVKKQLGSGSSGGGDTLSIEQLEAGVVELEKAGALDPITRQKLRIGLGAAKLARASGK